MPSTGTMKGLNIVLEVGGVQVTHITENSWEYSTDMLETTDKDSAEDASFLPGKRSFTASVSVNFAEDATYGHEDFFDAWLAGTALTIKRTSGVSGDKEFSGSAYINNISESAPNDGIVTLTVALQGTGVVTKGTIS